MKLGMTLMERVPSIIDTTIKPDKVTYEFDPTSSFSLKVTLNNDLGDVHGFIKDGVSALIFTEQELDWLLTVLQLVKEDIRHD